MPPSRGALLFSGCRAGSGRFGLLMLAALGFRFCAYIPLSLARGTYVRRLIFSGRKALSPDYYSDSMIRLSSRSDHTHVLSLSEG